MTTYPGITQEKKQQLIDTYRKVIEEQDEASFGFLTFYVGHLPECGGYSAVEYLEIANAVKENLTEQQKEWTLSVTKKALKTMEPLYSKEQY